MGLKYYSKEFNNSPLLSDIDIPLYANTSVSCNKKYQSRSSSLETYTSIRNLQNNIYTNLSKLTNDATYSTLMNTTSITLPSNTSSQILNENINNRIYENVKLSLSHIYINLKHDEDKSTVISTNNQKENIQLSSIDPIEIKQIDIETNILEKHSNIKTKQTVKKFEVNMAPSCSDKSDLYRTKIPSSLRQRRTLHRPRRYRRRSSTPFRAIRRQQKHSNSNTSLHHSMIASKSVSNQLYEIQQPILSDTKIFQCPLLQHHILAWYPVVNYHEKELIPQVCSTSENGESVHQDEVTTTEDEFCPHDTFEDFLLRRRPKSSCSTLASVTNTIISSETISEEKISIQAPPSNPRSPDITLSLDKKDVDFIHDIIQRTHGDQRVSNRITALKEAYIRAENKRNDLLKAKRNFQINENKNKKKPIMKPSFITSKIRDELEKYDELPVHRRPIVHDDDDDDDTYSANDDYRHRRLPPVPSTADRIINFVITLKRQLQKNFHDIRSRILIEAMSNSRHKPIFHNRSGLSNRHRSRPKLKHNNIRRTNSRHSIEHFNNPFQQHQFSRTHSNTSRMYSHHPSPVDKHLSNRPRTFRITPQLQRRQRMG